MTGTDDGNFAGSGASPVELPTDLIPELNTTVTGGFGLASSNPGNNTSSGDGDFGCGGGGNRISTSLSSITGVSAGNGGTGAGGGGAYHYSSSGSVDGTASSGGNGLLIIQCIS